MNGLALYKAHIEPSLAAVPPSEEMLTQIAEFALEASSKPAYPTDFLNAIDPITNEERSLGEAALHSKCIGVILLAGGVGSRLGFDGPKGLMNIGGQTLFERFLKKCPHNLDIAILCNKHFEADISAYLKQNSYFGHSDLSLLLQKEAPYTIEGKWFLESPTRIAAAPNGNGGLLDAEGFASFLNNGHEYVYILPVDNPSLPITPAELLGRALKHNLDICLSATAWQNGMGALSADHNIIDYPFLPETSTPTFGNVNHFCIKTSFLKTNPRLPVHSIQKETLRYDTETKITGKVTCKKQEKFITDLTLLTDHIGSILVPKSQFTPIKRKEDIENVM